MKEVSVQGELWQEDGDEISTSQCGDGGLRHRHRHRLNFAGYSLHELLRIAEVTLGLDAQPKARRLAEIPAQPQRRVECDRPLAVDDFIHPATRHTQRAGERVLRLPNRLHVFFEEDFPRRHVVEIRVHGLGFD